MTTSATKEAQMTTKVTLPRRYPTRYERNYHNLIRKVVAKLATEAKTKTRRDSAEEEIKLSLKALAIRVVASKSEGIADLLGFDFFRNDSELLALIDGWVETNIGLITSISEEYLGDVRDIVSNAFLEGESASSIAARISNTTGAAYKRAKLIARNEMGNLNSSVDLFQAKKLGAKEYIWRTSRDERVRGNPNGRYPKARPSHYAREGKTYDITTGAGGSDIHPASGILCRCTAEIVIEI